MNIAVLLSGGVDSSVALRFLQEQGHSVTAFYLKIWLEDELSYLGSCPWQEDLQYAQAVCDQVGVPLEVVSLQKEYWDHVVSYTIAEIKAGRTPNPDVFCNKLIKFGFFMKKLNELGKKFDKIASGHYAQIIEKDSFSFLCCAPDQIKDQTYFLSYLTQDQLSKLLFPIGHLQKHEVRALAQQYDLPNKDRKDSQGICFLGKLKFSEFVRHHLGDKKGDMIESETGTKLGEHNGFWYYTFGQRQGLGLSGGPWYVVKKDTEKNIVYISKNYYSEEKARDHFFVKDINWLIKSLKKELKFKVKLRHGKHLYKCTVLEHENGVVEVKIAERDQGISPGQFAVFYSENVCLGGGIISLMV